MKEKPASISMAALQWLLAQSEDIDRSDTEVTPGSSHRPLLLDVRSLAEFEQNHIPGAIHLPLETLPLQIANVAETRRQLILYCASGSRAEAAARQLVAMGYVRVSVLAEAFPDADMNTRKGQPSERTNNARYARQQSLPQVGALGQERLRAAEVLIIGLGGLGSPVALYLAAAGLGALELCDSDEVELSNLQRQILHTTPRVGAMKTASAQIALRALNPAVRVTLHPHVDRRWLRQPGDALRGIGCSVCTRYPSRAWVSVSLRGHGDHPHAKSRRPNAQPPKRPVLSLYLPRNKTDTVRKLCRSRGNGCNLWCHRLTDGNRGP
jgi:rhodanese-related sulfurtransferase